MGRMESPDENYERVSVRLSGQRAERFRAYLDEHDDLAKSDVLREGIDAILDADAEGDDGRQPPAEDDLVTAWRSLLRMTGGGDGWVNTDRACSALAQSVPDVNKSMVYGQLLRPLSRRGYVKIASNATGRHSSVYVYR